MIRDGVSVVVCCHNSEARLPRTLQHLWDQKLLDGGQIEVLLIDNNCSDRTVAVTEKSHLEANTSIPLRIIRETTPGLTSARITGIRHASFDTIILCDDDNWLDSNYCRVAYELLTQNGEIGLAGGCSEGVFEVDPPDWFNTISGAWALGCSDYRGLLQGDDAFLRGAGLVVRQSFFMDLIDSGFQFIATDRNGKSLSSGGDAEISREFVRRNHRLYFDCRLRLQHWIPANRLTREYALRLWEGFGAGTIPGDADRIAKLRSQPIRNRIRTSWVYQVIRGFIHLGLTVAKSPMFHPSDPRPSLGWCSQRGRISAIASLKSEYRLKISQRVEWIKQEND